MGTGDGHVVGTTKVVDHGSPAVRWNIAILADGYQATEQAKFHTDVGNFVNTLKSTPPYGDVWCGINVFRIDVVSNQSGADDPTACGGTGATVATYFDATFCTAGIQRLLTVNNSTVINVVNAQVPQAHVMVVIVNTSEYGGSGGGVATFSTAPSASDIGIHETGHTAFGFADEYDYWADCSESGHDHYTGGEPGQPNVTISTNRATLKWGGLVAASTALPTMANPDCTKCDGRASTVPGGTVGAFEGAIYNKCGAYRPEYNCKMRQLAQPFCAVCRQVIRQHLNPYATCCSSWTYGVNTIAAGVTERWWLWWPTYPGFEVIGVEPATPGAELQVASPGMQTNADASATYLLTITNAGATTVEYAFRGSAL